MRINEPDTNNPSRLRGHSHYLQIRVFVVIKLIENNDDVHATCAL